MAGSGGGGCLGAWACFAIDSSRVMCDGTRMLDHFGFFVTDTERSFAFYESCLAPLGVRTVERQPEWGSVVMTGEADVPFLWVGPAERDGEGNLRQAVRTFHFAFTARSREAVDEFYRAGLQNGGRDNGAPEEEGGVYHAFLFDPDGNNIEAIFRG
ncbi:VOC family protein [Terrimicrobium sacchariphilum]|nr:VOC family protein [Terrimicrobium sacchariphilum]